MLKEVIIFALAIATIIECSSIKRGFKVYNGDVIRSWADNPYKFVVMLQGKGTCSGSIFNFNTVLSAGHCFRDQSTKPTHIALEHTENPVHQTIEIQEVFIPPAYLAIQDRRQTSGLDFSVVRLERDINFESFSHVALKFRRIKVPVGVEVILVGYGLDSYNNGHIGTLRQGLAVVATCLSNFDDKRICVHRSDDYSNQMSSSGDSGMPLLAEVQGEYFGLGTLSGRKTYKNGFKEMVFASYKKHEKFIRNNSPRK